MKLIVLEYNRRPIMGAREDIARLLKEAAAAKKDTKTAIAKVESAYAIASRADDPDDTALVAEELARLWARRRSAPKSLYYAVKSTKLSPEQGSTWTTLAKTCELIATQTRAENKQRRARALYRAAAANFKKAASMTKDAEDKYFLLDLAKDAARQAKPPEGLAK